MDGLQVKYFIQFSLSQEEVIGKLIVEVTPSKMSKQQGEEILASLTQVYIFFFRAG